MVYGKKEKEKLNREMRERERGWQGRDSHTCYFQSKVGFWIGVTHF